MSQQGFHFSYGAFNSMFPFFILMDHELRMIELGSSLTKLFPDIKEQLFSNHFQIIRPHIDQYSYHDIKHQGRGVVMIKSDHIHLRGQLEILEDCQSILFIGAPWFNQADELTTSGLSIGDFAHHNPSLEFLQLLQTEEITNKELKDLLKSVNQKKIELERAYEKIKKISSSLEESNLRYCVR